MKNIYQLALGCKKISDERIGTDRNLIRYQNILFTDYTVKGNVDEYLAAIDDLRFALVPPSGEIQSAASDKISHSRVC